MQESMDRPRATRFRFGPFEADLISGELFENEKLVPLQAKPFQFLATLLRSYGEVVTREAISHALWPDIYVQVNQGLNAAVRKVRMALHDDAAEPKFVETVGSRGYRFMHPTEVLRWSTQSMASADQPVRIAVLPFQSEAEQDVELAGGLTRQLIAELNRVNPRIIAVAGTDLSLLNDGDTRIESLRKQLDVSHVLSGTFSRRSRKLEVLVALTALQDKVRIWEQGYEVPGNEIESALKDVTIRVLQHFQNICSTAIATATRKPSWPAYEEFLRGQHRLTQKDSPGLKAAACNFQRSTELDAEFVPAYIGLAKSYNLLGVFEWMEPRLAYMKSSEAAKRALDLEPNCPEAMAELGWSALALHRDWANATRLLEHALQAQPNLVAAHCNFAFLLLSRTRVGDAIAILEQARRIKPTSRSLNNRLAMAFYYSRRYDEAIEQSELSLAMDATSPEAHALIGMSLLAKQRLNDALQHFQLALEHSSGDAISIARLAYAQAHAGRFEIAAGMLKKIESQYETVPSYEMALVQLALGDVSQAFRWLETAYQQCSHWVLLMRLDPRLDLLRGSRRFDQMNRMLLPRESRRSASTN